MKCVGIDPGLACGWAIFDGSDVVLSGVWNLKGGRFDGAGMRFVRLRRVVEEILAPEQRIELVAFEEVRRHRGTDAAHMYGAITSHIQEMAEVRGIPCTSIPVATVKRAATGKGRADKDAMVAAARRRWAGFDGDDNEADARWIAVAAASEFGAKSAQPAAPLALVGA